MAKLVLLSAGMTGRAHELKAETTTVGRVRTDSEVVAVVAEVVGDLDLQRGLRQPLGELGEQHVLAGRLQPTLMGSASQPRDQLLIDRVENICGGGSPPPSSSRSTTLLLGHHLSHRVLPPKSELHG